MVIALFCLPGLLSAQELSFGEARRLSNRINSDAEELMPLLSPDGRTLYFVRAGSPENVGGRYSGSDIWKSDWDVTLMDWGKATNIRDLFNDKSNNAVVGISGKGDILYMLNTRSDKKTKGIYFSKKVGTQWTKPELIPIPGLETEGFLGAYVSPDFEVIILSLRQAGGKGEEDLYVSLKNSAGEWSMPKNLGPSINTSGFEISPFLSLDKSKLFFSSNGHGGYGDADILVSERLYGSWDIWSVPRNLGVKINSAGFDSYFSIYADTVAYYARNFGGKGTDLFTLKVSYVSNVLPSGASFLTEEELNEIYPKRISTRLDFNKGISTLSNDQNEIVWFVANRVLSKTNIQILIWVREEEDSKNTLERTAEILRALKLVGFDESRIAVSTQRIKPEVSKSGGGVIEILLFR